MKSSERVLFLKEALQLQTHPEGGFFKEVYRSSKKIDTETLEKSTQANEIFTLVSISSLLLKHFPLFTKSSRMRRGISTKVLPLLFILLLLMANIWK